MTPSVHPRNEIHLLWKNPDAPSRFRTGVSLHNHTSQSREPLDFLPHFILRVPLMRTWVAAAERRHERISGSKPDYARAYWTPPLTPHEVLAAERRQIEGFGLRSFVSLTDHDRIDAPQALQVIEPAAEVPVSLEWTVPYEQAQLHIGVHNLPPACAQSVAAELSNYTSSPKPSLLAELLAALDSMPDVLLVLNHPLSDQTFVLGRRLHESIMVEFLRRHGERIHALELNGLHSHQDNRDVLELAKVRRYPVVSGGDRHGLEESANINLTNAECFADFVREIREGRISRVAFLPHYRESLTLRYIENISDAVRYLPALAGREHWTDRVFYDDGFGPAPLRALLKKGEPSIIRYAIGLLETVPRYRPTLRRLFAERREVTLDPLPPL